MGPSPDWAAVRRLFPALRERVYVNTASQALGAEPVVAEVRGALDAWSRGTASWRAWEERAEAARGLFATLIGARAEEVALVSSMSGAAGQVAACLPAPAARGRANLVLGAEEFRSNLFPWLAQERRGFEIRLVPFRDGRLAARDVVAAIDGRTALVAVSHVQSASGYRIDLRRLAEACAELPTRLFVDATQSLGGLQVPLEGVDYLGCAAYKWLLAPRGPAFLYVAPDRLEEQFPIQPSWKTPADPYADYYGLPYEPAARASRLDASLAWPVWLGAARALELVLEVGPAAIEAHDLALARSFCEGLVRAGHRPLFGGDELSPIVALRVADPDGLQRRLADAGVVAAVRAGHLRTSFHLYNDDEDVERVLEALGPARAGDR